MKPLLFIFAKAPFMGQVKTRLAADIGPVHAQRFYRSMCAKIFRECRDPRWDTVLYLTPDRCVLDNFGGLWPDHMLRVLQKHGDLTDRLARAFSVKRTIIAIGTDAPQIKRRDIAQGFKSLKSHTAVFGPAEDGGFWLIGLNGPAPSDLFDDVRWSHPDTLSDMKKKINGRVAALRTLSDIDTGEALRWYKTGRK